MEAPSDRDPAEGAARGGNFWSARLREMAQELDPQVAAQPLKGDDPTFGAARMLERRRTVHWGLPSIVEVSAAKARPRPRRSKSLAVPSTHSSALRSALRGGAASSPELAAGAPAPCGPGCLLPEIQLPDREASSPKASPGGRAHSHLCSCPDLGRRLPALSPSRPSLAPPAPDRPLSPSGSSSRSPSSSPTPGEPPASPSARGAAPIARAGASPKSRSTSPKGGPQGISLAPPPPLTARPVWKAPLPEAARGRTGTASGRSSPGMAILLGTSISPASKSASCSPPRREEGNCKPPLELVEKRAGDSVVWQVVDRIHGQSLAC